MAVTAEVATLFLDELARRNIPVSVDDQGGYAVEMNGCKVSVHLDNISGEYERDRDPGRIARFVETILNTPRLPDWEEARPRLRWQAEAADHDFGATFHDKVSDEVALVLVYVTPDETQIVWLAPDLAQRWGKTRNDLWAAAVENMAALVRAATVNTTAIDEHTLGMLATDRTAFKAALLFSPHLKEIVEPVLGWPLFAVMPARDFVYLLNQKDRELLGRMGPVVVREYDQGSYPLSTEVFEITDQGIRALFEYQKAPKAAADEEEVSEDGMKTICYRGGSVVFRIPAHWEEEYEEEGGGTFYDEDGSSTLRLNTILLSSKDAVTTHTARTVLESRKEAAKGEVIDLGKGNCMIAYAHETEEEEPLTIRYWEIANPVPLRHVRIALFSFTFPSDDAADEEVIKQLALLDREIRNCTFADRVGS